MVDLLNTKTSSAKKKSCELTNSLGKRANVQCVVCKQKYPYIVRTGSGEDYICSRCKKNDDKRSVCRKCNIVMPHRLMREHMELHAKAEMRRKSRVGLPQKPSPMKHQQMLKNRSIPKYKCPVCPKRYMTAQHLAEHIKCMHGKKSYCEICGRDLKNNETFEKHIKNHAEQVADYKCPPKSIRMKQTSKTHHVAREKRCD
ncbi:unnamed protein product [Diatraea saccharalis]|uniref:C2H2-type domain-containing protein n=1 Tax=Diatraea saccharalis TaxID=40085 RepID=A0A9N9WEN0_9NEOP|nr:unnamed protein product [Diatraea saccharalis]